MSAQSDTGLFRHDPDTQQFAAGEVIFRQSDAGNLMYVVQQGQVTLAVDGEVVETVGPDGIFGEMAVIDDLPRSATATAKTDVRVVPIDEKRIVAVFSQNPFFAIQIMRTLSRRMRRANAELGTVRLS